VRNSSTVAGFLSRDRIILAGCILVVTALAWIHLLHLAEQMSLMPAMSMSVSSKWSATDYFLTFAMWATMMVGMMSPTAMPTLLLFSAMQKNRDRSRLNATVAVFGVGYITVWIAFSAFAALAQLALHQSALLSPRMATTNSILAGVTLVLAGAYQLTPLKAGCLRQCQTPLGFLMTNWREGAKGALEMGLRHGKYCLGCCWALMLVLFVVGVMNLAWVAALTVVILVEKFFRAGLWVARASGIAMIVFGILVMARG
jgi:predicted metal-binding membrane protein